MFTALLAFLAPVHDSLQVADLFKGKAGCFVLRDCGTGKQTIYNPTQAYKRLSPYSTFKIPNTLLAFETRIVTTPQDTFVWKGSGAMGRPEVEKNLTMRQAFQLSAVWVYQEVARKVGKPSYRSRLREFKYGNQDLGGPVDRFWLGSSLKISALEQVEFLSGLAKRRFRLPKSTYDGLDAVAQVEKRPGYTLYAKTGSARSGLNWYVGWVKAGPSTWAFAMNLEGKSANRSDAIRIARLVLKRRGVIR